MFYTKVKGNRRVLGALGVDARTALGIDACRLLNELVAYVGGRPTLPQRLAIERVIRTRVHLAELDEKLFAGGWTERDTQDYTAVNRAFREALRVLERMPRRGLEVEAGGASSLADLIGQHLATSVQQ
jgi:hypothetical protein